MFRPSRPRPPFSPSLPPPSLPTNPSRIINMSRQFDALLRPPFSPPPSLDGDADLLGGEEEGEREEEVERSHSGGLVGGLEWAAVLTELEKSPVRKVRLCAPLRNLRLRSRPTTLFPPLPQHRTKEKNSHSSTPSLRQFAMKQTVCPPRLKLISLAKRKGCFSSLFPPRLPRLRAKVRSSAPPDLKCLKCPSMYCHESGKREVLAVFSFVLVLLPKVPAPDDPRAAVVVGT